MIFSKPSEYAIRVLVYLAVKSSDNKRYGTKQIAKDLGFPEPYLGKVLQQLARKEIISSFKGPKGGFYLKEDALDITLLEIVKSIEGLAFFSACGLGLHDCNDEKPCPIHNDYQLFRDNFYKILSEKTIREMKVNVDKGGAFLNIDGHGSI
jgi:Rrf2 family protein